MKEVTDVRLLSRIRGIKLLILDVDGVMTDGRIIIDDAGLESKQFDVRDGHGLKMLMRYGIDVVLLTGRKSRVVDHRAADLEIKEVHQGIWNKREVFDEILKRRKLSPEETAYIGDDVVDIPVLKRVGFRGCRGRCLSGSHRSRRLCDGASRRSGGGPGSVRNDPQGPGPMGGSGCEV